MANSAATPIHFMSLGNVVSASLRLYNSHLKAYLSIATKSALWAVLPWFVLMLILVSAIVPYSINNRNSASLSLLLLLLPWLGLVAYCTAKSHTNAALICRLSYRELIGQPESVREAFGKIKRNTWNFLLLQIIVGAALFGIYMGISIAFQVAAVPLVALAAVAPAVIVILSLILPLAVMSFYYWCYAHWFIPEAMFVNEEIGVFDVIERCWRLSHQSAMRILSIILVAGLITLPLFGLLIVPVLTLIGVVSASTAETDPSVYLGTSVIFFVSLVLVLTFINIFFMPFWQCLKSVVYFDLRVRQEGLDFGIEGTAQQQFFKSVTIRTPESVDLEFTLAGIGSRALAILIDTLAWWLALVSLLFLFSVIGGHLTRVLPKAVLDPILLWLQAILVLTFFVVYVGYFVLFETLWQGQTPGKRFANIRVIRDDGRTARLGQAVLRSLLRPVDDYLSLGFFFILLGKQEKRLGDWLAGTLVVQEAQAEVATRLVLSEEARSLAPQLLATANIYTMSPNDFAIVRSYLQRRNRMDSKARSELSLKLARQMQTLIQLETLPFNMTPNLFLEAVYLAYQQQSN